MERDAGSSSAAERSSDARRRRSPASAFAGRRSTIAGPSAKSVPNGRFAEGLCFARVLRGFRDLRRSGASSENAGGASSQGRKRVADVPPDVSGVAGLQRSRPALRAEFAEECGEVGGGRGLEG